MRQSKFFTKTSKTDPKDAATFSHKFLVKAGYINQLTSGAWSLLPLGLRVYKKIENIIREEMNALGAEEILMPSLQPKELWLETGRWDTIDPPLFKVKDRHEKWLALGSTHEEVVTDLARTYIESYKDLPKAVYQIQNKFRNEMRPTGGLLRTREFIMKDLYSFHKSSEDLDDFYEKVKQAYFKIYDRCELKAVAVEASSGSIGGSISNEFMILADSGEDKILVCPKCDWGANTEIGKDITECPKCSSKLEIKNAIEISHVFKLKTVYSQKMNLNFTDSDGQKKLVMMGCYGIGLQRLMATIIEASHDQNGIIWPASVSPFNIHLIGLDLDDKNIAEQAEKIYEQLSKKYEVLFDDRQDSAGAKFKDADLIGIPVRLVVSKKTGDKVEYKERNEKTIQLMTIEQIINKLK